MSHPLDFIPGSFRKKIFFALLALTLGLFGVFNVLDAPLRTDAAPNGIVSFELAGTPVQAEAILQSWDAHAKQYAAFGLGLDYLFMLVYALAISLGALMAARKHGGKFAMVGNLVGWGALFAALFDALENLALWRLLSGWAALQCSGVAAFSATTKFILILGSVGFALLGWLLPAKK